MDGAKENTPTMWSPSGSGRRVLTPWFSSFSLPMTTFMFPPKDLRKSYHGSSRQSEPHAISRITRHSQRNSILNTETLHIYRLFDFTGGKCAFSISLIIWIFVYIDAPFLPTKCLKWLYSKNTNIEIKIKWNEKVGKCKYTWKIKTKKKRLEIYNNWRRKWHPTSVFLLGKSHGQGSLAGCSPQITKIWTQLSTHTCNH